MKMKIETKLMERSEMSRFDLEYIIGLFFGFAIGAGVMSAVWKIQHDDSINMMERTCMYENRIQFNSELYSCTWLKGVESK